MVFGHSGHLEQLHERNGWMLVAVALMLLGMATRISGDFWPRILVTHYSFGAGIWMITGALVWSWFVLTNVLQADNE